MKTVIATAGMPGSGKGVITDFLVEKGFDVVVMSNAVKEKMAEKGIDVNNHTLRNFAKELREKHGRNIVAQLCIDEINSMENCMIVLDGVRSPEEVEFMRNQNIKFILIAVDADKETRFQRILSRGRSDDMKTREEFEFREKKEIGYGQDKVIGMADYKISNEGSIKDFDKKLEELLNRIL